MQFKTFSSKNSMTLTPYTFLTPSVATSSKIMIAMLLLQVILLAATKSFSALVTTFSALAASVACETAFKTGKNNFRTNYPVAVIQGLITGLLIPQNYPFLIVFIITFFCFLSGKYVFGSFASSWVNPAALTVAVLFFLDPSYFPSFTISAHSLQARNAALSLIQDGSVKIFTFDYKITDFLNKNIFSFFKISIPNGYISMILDSGSLIPAFRFNLLSLISLILFISYSILDFIIPSIFLLAYLLLVRLLLPNFINGTPLQGDMLLALLTSGTIFYSTYLLQWYGTNPLTKAGKVFYAFTAAVFAFIIIGFGTSSAGFIFVILIMNLISPMIQYFENRKALSSIKKYLLPKVNAVRENENV